MFPTIYYVLDAVNKSLLSFTTVVPNLFATRNWFHGRQFFHGPGRGGGMVQEVTPATGGDGEQQTKLLRSLTPAAPLLLCGPVPNRLQTGTSPWPGGWGPLLYKIPNKEAITAPLL